MKFVPKTLTRKVGGAILKSKKNSPHIFFVGGVIGVVGAGVLACKATLNLEETLDDIRADLDLVKAHHANDETPDRDEKKDMGMVYGHAAVQILKLYGPSIVVGAISIAALTGSHVQLVRRNAALTATLASLTKVYEDYRARVREVIGEKAEHDIYRNLKEEKVDGKKVVTSDDPSRYSMYSRIFDEANPNWKKDSSLNLMFLRAIQKTANYRLQAYGHVFLNDIYKELGFEDIPEGQLVGWLWNSNRGDNYIDFGLDDEDAIRFIEGYEYNVWLDFNVDGPIHEDI